ncbi:hypothetical protein CC78DRAFT_606529 [Lojkania enalia]|uniref:Oxidase ustYa n=1 Tax=Lojkania enalia TaxID=147567 RepID=A0A9P4K323_9PLEO|nr:hypothetical protein CC78DRAFT_606529 [Didymosphaeria enalia]
MGSEKHDFDADEEEEAFLPRSQPSGDEEIPPHATRRPTTFYLRIFLEVTMAFAIVFLLFLRPSSPSCRIRNTPVPQFPRKMYTFTNDPHYAREDMFFNESTTLRTLHNWIPLSSASRGYIVLPPSPSSILPKPYTVPIDRFTDGPGYMMSVFHQLHCLSYLAEHFQQGYGGVELDDEVAHHSAHCFNYLRQGITCAGDTTLEGETEQGPGEGSVHECVDYDKLLGWANAHSAYRWREGLLPGESIL